MRTGCRAPEESPVEAPQIAVISGMPEAGPFPCRFGAAASCAAHLPGGCRQFRRDLFANSHLEQARRQVGAQTLPVTQLPLGIGRRV